MPVPFHPHATLPFGTSLVSGSVDDSVRPNLRRAFPLAENHGSDPRFQERLDALAQLTHQPPSDADQLRHGSLA